MNILADVQKALSAKIDAIDSLTYKPNYNYLESTDANVTFPELYGIDLFNIVDFPNKNSSPQTKKEIDYIANLANNRTLEQIKFVYEVDEDPMILFEPIIKEFGLEFPYRKFNTIYWNVVSPIIDHLKNFYNRARPFQVAEYYNIKIDRLMTKTHHTPSYPSGHTMYGALIAEILISLYPAKTDIFDQTTQKVGLARVLQGVHYPSDNDASIKIVKKIYPSLHKYYIQEMS